MITHTETLHRSTLRTSDLEMQVMGLPLVVSRVGETLTLIYLEMSS